MRRARSQQILLKSFVLLGSLFWPMLSSAQTITISFRTSSQTKALSSSHLFLQGLRRRGFQIQQRSLQGLTIHIVWKQPHHVLMQSPNHRHRFQLPRNLKRPWIRARTVLTYLDLFIDASIANTLGLQKQRWKKAKRQLRSLSNLKLHRSLHKKPSLRPNQAQKQTSPPKPRLRPQPKPRPRSQPKPRSRSLLQRKRTSPRRRPPRPQRRKARQKTTRSNSTQSPPTKPIPAPKSEPQTRPPAQTRQNKTNPLSRPKPPRPRRVAQASPTTSPKNTDTLVVKRKKEPPAAPRPSWNGGADLALMMTLPTSQGIPLGAAIRLFGSYKGWRLTPHFQMEGLVGSPSDTRLLLMQTALLLGPPSLRISKQVVLAFDVGPTLEWIRVSQGQNTLWSQRLGGLIHLSTSWEWSSSWAILVRGSFQFSPQSFQFNQRFSNLTLPSWRLSFSWGVRWKLW